MEHMVAPRNLLSITNGTVLLLRFCIAPPPLSPTPCGALLISPKLTPFLSTRTKTNENVSTSTTIFKLIKEEQNHFFVFVFVWGVNE